MECKFVILLGLASLLQASYVPTLTVSYGLPEDQVAVLNQIIINQYTVESIYLGKLGAFYDVLLTADKESDINSQVLEVFTGLGEGLALAANSVLVATAEPCAEVESGLEAAVPYLQNVVSTVATAAELAQSPYSSKIQEQIEIHQATATVAIGTSFVPFYNAIRSCVPFTDPDLAAVIQNARQQTILSFVDGAEAIFDAIQEYGASDSLEAAASDINAFRETTLLNVRKSFEYIFGLYKTIYLYPRLNQTGILADLATNQYALTYEYNRYSEAYGTLYGVIIEYATRIYNDSDVEISFADSNDDINKLIAQFAAAGSFTLDSIAILDSADEAAIEEYRQEFNDGNIDADLAFPLAIQVAVDQDGGDPTRTSRIIAGYRDQGVSPVAGNTRLIFNMIRNVESWGNETDAGIDSLEAQATTGIELASNRFFDGVVLLARNVFERNVTAADLASYEALQDESLSGVASFLQAVSAAGVSVLKAAQSSQAAISSDLPLSSCETD